MSQLKEQDGRYYQEAEVVILATANESALPFISQRVDGFGDYSGGLIYKNIPIDGRDRIRHLYILSNEEIKEGDWTYNPEGVGIENKLVYIDSRNALLNALYFKWKCIIATTDDLVIVKENYPKRFQRSVINLPKPSDSFIKKYIEEYNKGNVITNVLVEYEIGKSYSGNNGLEIKQWLKVDSNNEITIKKVKDTYTREEVIKLLNSHTKAIVNEASVHIPIIILNKITEEFIKEQL